MCRKRASTPFFKAPEGRYVAPNGAFCRYIVGWAFYKYPAPDGAKNLLLAEKYQQIRIIDKSGEDYLYSAAYFALIELPKVVEEAFLQAV